LALVYDLHYGRPVFCVLQCFFTGFVIIQRLSILKFIFSIFRKTVFVNKVFYDGAIVTDNHHMYPQVIHVGIGIR